MTLLGVKFKITSCLSAVFDDIPLCNQKKKPLWTMSLS